jgi:hypothetical protein
MVEQKVISIHKILGVNNPADILTKAVDRETLQRHLEHVGMVDGLPDEVTVSSVALEMTPKLQLPKLPWKYTLASTLICCLDVVDAQPQNASDNYYDYVWWIFMLFMTIVSIIWSRRLITPTVIGRDAVGQDHVSEAPSTPSEEREYAEWYGEQAYWDWMDGLDRDENPDPASWYHEEDESHSDSDDTFLRLAMRVDGDGNDPEDPESEHAESSEAEGHHVRFAGG